MLGNGILITRPSHCHSHSVASWLLVGLVSAAVVVVNDGGVGVVHSFAFVLCTLYTAKKHLRDAFVNWSGEIVRINYYCPR